MYLILFLVFEDIFIRLYIAGTESSLPEYYPVSKNVVILLIGTHYAVAWHRAIVLGESPSIILRLRGTEPFYAITAFLLWLGPNVLSWVIHSLNPNSVNKNRLVEEFGIWGSEAVGHEVLIIGVGLVYLSLFIAALVLSLILPGIAIGDREITIGLIWQRLRGHRFPMIVFGAISYGINLTISTAAIWLFWQIGNSLNTFVIDGFGKEWSSVIRGFYIVAETLIIRVIPPVILLMFSVSATLASYSIVYDWLIRRNRNLESGKIAFTPGEKS